MNCIQLDLKDIIYPLPGHFLLEAQMCINQRGAQNGSQIAQTGPIVGNYLAGANTNRNSKHSKANTHIKSMGAQFFPSPYCLLAGSYYWNIHCVALYSWNILRNCALIDFLLHCLIRVWLHIFCALPMHYSLLGPMGWRRWFLGDNNPAFAKQETGDGRAPDDK